MTLGDFRQRAGALLIALGVQAGIALLLLLSFTMIGWSRPQRKPSSICRPSRGSRRLPR
jgi:hypothetical protein